VDEGVGWLERGLAVEPEHPPTLALLALHAIGAGDEPRARAWLERVARQPRVPREQAERLRTAWRERFGSVAP
jgi:Tfp pilus assembly protein PilF